MKQLFHTAPTYIEQPPARNGTDETRWSLVRLVLAAMLTAAVLAAATGLTG